MYQIVLIQIVFQGCDRVEHDFWGFVIKIALNFKFRGTEKIQLSSQGTYNFEILVNETHIIADHNRYAKVFKFPTLDIKLQLKDDDSFLSILSFWLNEFAF